MSNKFWMVARECALVAVLVCTAGAQELIETRLAEGRRLNSQQRYAEARSRFAEALRLAQEVGDSRWAGLVLEYMGINEEDRGNYASAETIFSHGLSGIQPYAAHDPVLIDLQTHLADLYIAEMRPKDAERLLRRTVEILRSTPHSDSFALASADEDLAIACTMLKEYSEAGELLNESQTLLKARLGPDNPRLAIGLFSLARLLAAEHKPAAAVEPAERGWNMLESSNPPTSKSHLASAASALSSIYYLNGRLDDAEVYGRKALDLVEESLPAAHPRHLLCLSNYGVILKRLGRKKEAKAIQKRVETFARASYRPAAETINISALH